MEDLWPNKSSNGRTNVASTHAFTADKSVGSDLLTPTMKGQGVVWEGPEMMPGSNGLMLHMGLSENGVSHIPMDYHNVPH